MEGRALSGSSWLSVGVGSPSQEACKQDGGPLAGEGAKGPQPRDPGRQRGQAAGSRVMEGPARAGRGQAGPEGHARVGPASPEGEGCLTVAAITQLGWTVSFLLPDLLPASEG